ncbi:MAG: ATP-dependent RNA helicase DbpA [Halieaceae bacterium]|nr:ATP-dependent RNA helicase DbpA [Halieaceae bacterium]
MAAEEFSSLPLGDAQQANLIAMGYSSMTPIQAASLPHLLAGRDVLARAKTGSGKTAAFGIALVHRLRNLPTAVPQAVVLCPTRELVDQVVSELRLLARVRPNTRVLPLVGGRPMGAQKQSLLHGADLVVGTPGRVLDLLRRGAIVLRETRTLVLDEADRMLDMGFADDMDAIIAELPAARQTLLFSATYPETVAAMSRRVLREPLTVSVDTTHSAAAIEQRFCETKPEDRREALLTLYRHFRPASSLVFCKTRRDCDVVAGFLRDHAIECLALHGDLEQNERDAVLAQFANGSCPVLVATDVAARGLDIPGLRAVFNYELPRDTAVYLHRIGRTGRAGESGMAISLYAPAEASRLDAIAAETDEPVRRLKLASLDSDPSFVLRGAMATIEVNAGRKQKLRPGDLLGALTGDGQIPGTSIGRISIFEQRTFVAVDRRHARQAMAFLADGRVKGRRLRARRLR